MIHRESTWRNNFRIMLIYGAFYRPRYDGKYWFSLRRQYVQGLFIKCTRAHAYSFERYLARGNVKTRAKRSIDGKSDDTQWLRDSLLDRDFATIFIREHTQHTHSVLLRFIIRLTRLLVSIPPVITLCAGALLIVQCFIALSHTFIFDDQAAK